MPTRFTSGLRSNAMRGVLLLAALVWLAPYWAGVAVSARSPEPHAPLGQFSTEFNTKEKNRSHNIRLAATAINRYVVPPGATFSYNYVVGDTNKARGYKKSTIFIKGEKFTSYGGGVCQVSTTLYNAAARAGMTIVERHDHSRPVPYAKAGQEAATSYGGIDFKFTNTLPFPIMITSYVEKGTVSVALHAL